MKIYPVLDNPTIRERKALGFSGSFANPNEIAAIDSGNFRPPRKGEWYLSSAVVGAYRTPSDLSVPCCIARLVRIEKAETVKIVGII